MLYLARAYIHSLDFSFDFFWQLPCGNFAWVPYDPKISPVENLYSNPDDLDPQPEYPLRTSMVYYNEEEAVAQPDLEVLEGDLHPMAAGQDGSLKAASLLSPPQRAFPSATLLLLLWIVGLCLWFYFMVLSNKSGKKRRNVGGNTNKDK